MKRKYFIFLMLACIMVSCAACSVTFLYQNHSDNSSIKTESSASADSSQLSITLPQIRSR